MISLIKACTQGEEHFVVNLQVKIVNKFSFFSGDGPEEKNKNLSINQTYILEISFVKGQLSEEGETHDSSPNPTAV